MGRYYGRDAQLEGKAAVEMFLDICNHKNSLDQVITFKAQRGCLICCMQTRDTNHHGTDWHRRIEKCISLVHSHKAVKKALDAPDERDELVRSLVRLRDELQGDDAGLLISASWSSFSPDEVLGENGLDGILVRAGAWLWSAGFVKMVESVALGPSQGSEEEWRLLEEIKRSVQDLPVRNSVRLCL